MRWDEFNRLIYYLIVLYQFYTIAHLVNVWRWLVKVTGLSVGTTNIFRYVIEEADNLLEPTRMEFIIASLLFFLIGYLFSFYFFILFFNVEFLLKFNEMLMNPLSSYWTDPWAETKKQTPNGGRCLKIINPEWRKRPFRDSEPCSRHPYKQCRRWHNIHRHEPYLTSSSRQLDNIRWWGHLWLPTYFKTNAFILGHVSRPVPFLIADVAPHRSWDPLDKCLGFWLEVVWRRWFVFLKSFCLKIWWNNIYLFFKFYF